MEARTADPLHSTLDVSDEGFAPAGVDEGKALQVFSPPSGGQQQYVVAQQVHVPRNYARFKAKMAALAASAGNRYYYGWEVKNKGGRKQWIEGPTIKLANDLAREYGNCAIDVRVQDAGTSWVFYARFIDLETGSNYTRAFQQRKGQDTGMQDAARQADIVFQIGQSKAIRNVIVNVLQTFADEVLELAKGSLLKRVGDNKDGAKKWILEELARLQIDRQRVEAIYGRTADNWTVPDMAKLYAEIQSIADGMMNAEDVFPAAVKADDETAGGKGVRPKKDKTEPKAGGATDASVTVNIVDSDGRLLGKHTGKPLKVGDPWDGGEKGLHHVESLGEEEGALIATVKKQPVVSGGKPETGTAVAPVVPAKTPTPPADAKAPAKKTATRKFFNEE